MLKFMLKFNRGDPKAVRDLMFIEPRQPFDFARTLRFILSPPAALGGRTFDPLLDYFEDGEYRRVAEIAGKLVLFAVRESEAGGSKPARLKVRILAGPADGATRRGILAQAARQFATDLDLAPLNRLAGSDPVLARLTAHFHGMRIPQSGGIFETLISAILEQQVNLTFAHKVKSALIATYGRQLDYKGRRYNAFPEPAALASSTPAELRQIQISGPKARYMIGISRAVLDGALDLEALQAADPATAYERLLALKGVGAWTAQYVGLRALGHLDCLPAADVGLQNMVEMFYGMRQRPGPAAIEKLARKWRGWRSYATFYLWLTYWEDASWRAQLSKALRQDRRLRRLQLGAHRTASSGQKP